MFKVIEGISQAFLTFLVLMMFVVPTLMYGSTIESFLLPVVKDFKAVEISHNEEGTIYAISFDKVRTCDPIAESFVWFIVDKDGNSSRVNRQSLTAIPGQDNTRPVGLNKGAAWLVSNTSEPWVSQKLVMYHSCHFLWRTITTIDMPAENQPTK